MSGVKDYQLNIKTYLITILDDMNNIIKELNIDDTSREVLLDIEVTIENETLDKLTHINNIIDYINHYLVNLIPRENPLTNEEYVYILEFLYIFYKYIFINLDEIPEKIDKLEKLFRNDNITLPKLEIIITNIKKSTMLDVPKNKFINDLVSNFSINKLEKIESINYHDYIEKKIKLIDLLNILSSTIKSKPITQPLIQPVENYQTYDYNLDYIENIISILKSIKGYILQYLVNTTKSNADIINDLNNFMKHNITYDITENINSIINTYKNIEENIKTSKTNSNLDYLYNILDNNLNNILEAYIGNKYININENEERLKLVYIIPEPIQQEKIQPPPIEPSVVQPPPIEPSVFQPPPTVPSVVQPPPTVPSVTQPPQSTELKPNILSPIKKSNKYIPQLNSIEQQQENQQGNQQGNLSGNQQGNQQQIIQSEKREKLNLPEKKPMPPSTNFIEPSNTEKSSLNIQLAPQQQHAPAAQLPQQQQKQKQQQLPQKQQQQQQQQQQALAAQLQQQLQQQQLPQLPQQQQQQQPNTPNQFAGDLSTFIEEIKKIKPVHVDLLEFIESNKSKPYIDNILSSELINELNILINEYNQNSEDFIENIKDFELFGINFESNINKFIECINSAKEYSKDIKIYKETIKNIQEKIEALKQPIKEEYKKGPTTINDYVSSKTPRLIELEKQKQVLENKIKGANMKIDLLKKTDSSKKKISITDIENCYTNEKDKLYNYLITYIKSNIDSEKNKQTDNIRKHVEKIYNYMQKSNTQELKIKELIKKIKNIIEIIIIYIKIFDKTEIVSNTNTTQVIYNYLQSIVNHFKEKHNITVLSLPKNFDNFDIYYETYIKQFEKIITIITTAKSNIFKFLEDLKIEIVLSCPKTPTYINSSEYSEKYKEYLGDLLKQEYFINNCCDDITITNISNKQKSKIDECNELDTCYYNYDKATCKHTEAFKKYLETQKELYKSKQELYDNYYKKYKKLIEIKNLLKPIKEPTINKIYKKLENILKPNDEVILKHLDISNPKNILDDMLMYYNELYDKYNKKQTLKKNIDNLKIYMNVLYEILYIYYMIAPISQTTKEKFNNSTLKGDRFKLFNKLIIEITGINFKKYKFENNKFIKKQ